jgi:hypothetical protein
MMKWWNCGDQAGWNCDLKDSKYWNFGHQIRHCKNLKNLDIPIPIILQSGLNMFRVLYSLLLIPAWSALIVKQINYNINKEYGNISVNFTTLFSNSS